MYNTLSLFLLWIGIYSKQTVTSAEPPSVYLEQDESRLRTGLSAVWDWF